jgi:hypothetical protein
MEKLSNRLIVFTRYPEPGNTKTRLISTLGPNGAAQFQKEMTEWTLSKAEEVKSASLEIRYEGGNKELMEDWLGLEFSLKPQGPGNLGEKMGRTFEESFGEGAKRVLILGSDCPGIFPSIIQEAFTQLDDNDLVLGPASDGGYYLIGLKTAQPGLFKDIPWGTNMVLQKTSDIGKNLGLNVYLLRTLSDIDRPEDLHILKSNLRKNVKNT